MKRAVFLLLCASLALGLTGCPGGGAGQYPMEVTGVADTADYPMRAAGFERYRILRYEPGDADISVGYNMLTPEAQIVSTIYISNESVFPDVLRENDPVAALFDGNKAGVEEYHPGARLMVETSETLTRNGREYTALVAAYSYEEDFMSKRQTVYSVLVLWRHGDRFIKLRSTAPFDQREQVRPHNLELLNAVNWTRPPS